MVGLTVETGLIGHDGWADGRFGDYAGSDVLLNDYVLIEELATSRPRPRLERLHALGDAAAERFRCAFPRQSAVPACIALTHVPPFREACWHQGQISDDAWLPHFAAGRRRGARGGHVGPPGPGAPRPLRAYASSGEARILPDSGSSPAAPSTAVRKSQDGLSSTVTGVLTVSRLCQVRSLTGVLQPPPPPPPPPPH